MCDTNVDWFRCDYIDYIYLAGYYEFISNLWMSNKSLWNDICSILLFWSIVENLLLLIAKCVEIYVYDNTEDQLTPVKLSQAVCIVWID